MVYLVPPVRLDVGDECTVIVAVFVLTVHAVPNLGGGGDRVYGGASLLSTINYKYIMCTHICALTYECI